MRVGKAAVKIIGKATEGAIVIEIVMATDGTIHNLICKGYNRNVYVYKQGNR